jgi:hypothetical protein
MLWYSFHVLLLSVGPLLYTLAHSFHFSNTHALSHSIQIFPLLSCSLIYFSNTLLPFHSFFHYSLALSFTFPSLLHSCAHSELSITIALLHIRILQLLTHSCSHRTFPFLTHSCSCHRGDQVGGIDGSVNFVSLSAPHTQVTFRTNFRSSLLLCSSTRVRTRSQSNVHSFIHPFIHSRAHPFSVK